MLAMRCGIPICTRCSAGPVPACWMPACTAPRSRTGERPAADAARILGPEHPDTLTARASLAFSYWQAGRTADAITIEEQVTANRTRILGPEHPDTLTARGNLAASYYQAGRTADAITIGEQVTADMARILGPEHPGTLNARANLAASYYQAGRTADAITIGEQVTADSDPDPGSRPPRHADRPGEPRLLLPAGRADGRRDHHRRAGRRRPDADPGPRPPRHPDRPGNLAASYRQAGRTADAITIGEQVAADRTRSWAPTTPTP